MQREIIEKACSKIENLNLIHFEEQRVCFKLPK